MPRKVHVAGSMSGWVIDGQFWCFDCGRKNRKRNKLVITQDVPANCVGCKGSKAVLPVYLPRAA